MPPKGRQKGAKRKRFVSNLAPFIYDAPAPDAVPPEYVKLRYTSHTASQVARVTVMWFRLAFREVPAELAAARCWRWPAVPTELSISLIKEAVHRRHRGTALDLTMWLNTVQPAASLQDVDDGCTLRELGVKGLAAGQPELLPLIQVFYDFTAPLCDDAIASGPMASELSRLIEDQLKKTNYTPVRADEESTAPDLPENDALAGADGDGRRVLMGALRVEARVKEQQAERAAGSFKRVVCIGGGIGLVIIVWVLLVVQSRSGPGCSCSDLCGTVHAPGEGAYEVVQGGHADHPIRSGEEEAQEDGEVDSVEAAEAALLAHVGSRWHVPGSNNTGNSSVTRDDVQSPTLNLEGDAASEDDEVEQDGMDLLG
ncbi:hypothetical protein QJQ45_019223 [Haematococcus lacustris]|nr:hypothetical protein QJQ45_019223 [Haematococcus lacustris]